MEGFEALWSRMLRYPDGKFSRRILLARSSSLWRKLYATKDVLALRQQNDQD